MKSKKIFTFIFLFSFPSLFAQNLVVKNPSFEGETGVGIVPPPWQVCYGSPDTQPGNFQVTLAASDGETYLGFVTTTGNNEEGASQKLSNPMVIGQNYKFTIDLAYSPGYSGWTAPCKLIIYGGGSACATKEILWVSPTITDIDWKEYPIDFTPTYAHKYITFSSWNGGVPGASNVLLDNLSPIVPNSDLSAKAKLSKTEICQKDCSSLTGFYSGGVGEPYKFQWTSIPAGFFSTDQNPGNVCPFEDTKYIFKVTDKNNFSVYDTVLLKVKPLPIPVFEYTKNGSTINFKGIDNNNVDFWEWDFGDRSPIIDSQNCSHTYLTLGKYTVTLIVRNSCGRDTAIFDIDVDGGSGSGSNVGLSNEIKVNEGFALYPNPAKESLNIKLFHLGLNNQVQLMDGRGKVILESKIINNPQTVNLGNLSKGLYFVKVYSNTSIFTKKLIIN